MMSYSKRNKGTQIRKTKANADLLRKRKKELLRLRGFQGREVLLHCLSGVSYVLDGGNGVGNEVSQLVLVILVGVLWAKPVRNMYTLCRLPWLKQRVISPFREFCMAHG